MKTEIVESRDKHDDRIAARAVATLMEMGVIYYGSEIPGEELERLLQSKRENTATWIPRYICWRKRIHALNFMVRVRRNYEVIEILALEEMARYAMRLSRHEKKLREERARILSNINLNLLKPQDRRYTENAMRRISHMILHDDDAFNMRLLAPPPQRKRMNPYRDSSDTTSRASTTEVLVFDEQDEQKGGPTA